MKDTKLKIVGTKTKMMCGLLNIENSFYTLDDKYYTNNKVFSDFLNVDCSLLAYNEKECNVYEVVWYTKTRKYKLEFRDEIELDTTIIDKEEFELHLVGLTHKYTKYKIRYKLVTVEDKPVDLYFCNKLSNHTDSAVVVNKFNGEFTNSNYIINNNKHYKIDLEISFKFKDTLYNTFVTSDKHNKYLMNYNGNILVTLPKDAYIIHTDVEVKNKEYQMDAIAQRVICCERANEIDVYDISCRYITTMQISGFFSHIEYDCKDKTMTAYNDKEPVSKAYKVEILK